MTKLFHQMPFGGIVAGEGLFGHVPSFGAMDPRAADSASAPEEPSVPEEPYRGIASDEFRLSRGDKLFSAAPASPPTSAISTFLHTFWNRIRYNYGYRLPKTFEELPAYIELRYGRGQIEPIMKICRSIGKERVFDDDPYIALTYLGMNHLVEDEDWAPGIGIDALLAAQAPVIEELSIGGFAELCELGDPQYLQYISEVCPTSRDMLSFVKKLMNISRHYSRDVFFFRSERDCHRIILHGLLKTREIRTLVKKFGAEPFVQALAELKGPPPELWFNALAEVSRVVHSASDLVSVIRELKTLPDHHERYGGSDEYEAYHSLIHRVLRSVKSAEDVRIVARVLERWDWLLGGFWLMTPRLKAVVPELKDVKELEHALFLFGAEAQQPHMERLFQEIGPEAIMHAFVSFTDLRTRRAAAHFLPYYASIIDSPETLQEVLGMIRRSGLDSRRDLLSDGVLVAFPAVCPRFRDPASFEEVLKALRKMDPGIMREVKHLKRLMSSIPLAQFREVGTLLRRGRTRFLAALSDDIASLEDLAEALALSKQVLERCAAMGERGDAVIGTLECKTRSEMRAWIALHDAGIEPTRHLLHALAISEDREATLQAWRAALASFDRGKFDPQNELHRNLEYTRFRAIVDHERMQRHVKNHFTYEDYERIFSQEADATIPLSETDRFEIECAAHEARLLHDFIRSVAARAKELGRPMLVVPNLSYGYLPVAPLVPALKAEGIDVAIGMKVGSTESHENKEVMNRHLFKGRRRHIVGKEPIIVVVDGTQHLVSRGDDGKAARYPDAYQGYLNQAIALNDALGFTGVDYSGVGKDEEDMKRLRATPEFQRLVQVYREMAGANGPKLKQPFAFHLWNTAEMGLVIRGDRKKLEKVPPVDPAAISGPSVIFANVGVLHEQIPKEIRSRYPAQEHQPAYFDDSGRILAFDFGYDDYGVKYLNRLETELKRAYGTEEADAAASAFIDSLQRFISKEKKRGRPPSESPEPAAAAG